MASPGHNELRKQIMYVSLLPEELNDLFSYILQVLDEGVCISRMDAVNSVAGSLVKVSHILNIVALLSKSIWRNMNTVYMYIYTFEIFHIYCQTSNIRCMLIVNKIVDHSDVVGKSPVDTAPTISSFWT